MSGSAGFTGPAEADLVARVRAGDRDAFAALYDRYADRLHDFCYSVLRNRDDAADATHDTFVLAAERLGQLRDPQRLRPWLYAIARNEALRRLRARGTVAPDAEMGEMADTSAGPAEAAERAALRELVWKAAAGLADRDRILLDLHLRQGLEGAELGEAVGVSAGHAYVLLNRMRDQVERSLGALLIARLGRADCGILDGLLAHWDGRFSPLIRKRVARHVDRCDVCGERRRTVVSPAALLSTVPVVAAPPALRGMVLDRVAAGTDHGPPSHRPRTRQRILGAAAAAVVMAGAVAVLWRGGPDAPPAPAAGPRPGPGLASSAASPTPSVPPAPRSASGAASPAGGPTAPRPVASAGIQVSTEIVDLGATASSETVTLSSSGGEEVDWTAEPADPWLSAVPAGGALAAGAETVLTVDADRSGLPEGDADGAITVTGDGDTVTVLVRLTEERAPEIGGQAVSPQQIGVRGCPTARASVRSTVTDESRIASVTLTWTAPDGSSSSRSMAPRADQWHASLGPFDEAGDVVWRVSATDSRGNMTTGPAATLRVLPCVR